MKPTKKWIICLLTILIYMSFSGLNVQAGGLNGPESGLVGAARGTFYYNGQTYVVAPDMLNQGINYLCQDGVDLTQEQANKVLGMAYGMVGEGVARGYLIPVGGKKGNSVDTSDIPQKSGSQAVKDVAELAGELGVKVTVDSANRKVTITNEDGKQILNFDGVIKNTGVLLDFDGKFFGTLIGYILLAVLLLLFASKRAKKQSVGKPGTKKSFILRNIVSPIVLMLMGVGLVGVIVMPAEKLLINAGKVVLSKSIPSYDNKLDSIYENVVKVEKKTVDEADVVMPANETHYGMIRCSNWGLDAKLYFGDTERVLREGVGQYMGSGIPGMGKPILLTGHSNTFMTGMSKVQKGDIVTIETSYGTYQYRIKKSTIAAASDTLAYDLGQDEEQLILYTCYPYGTTVGVRTERHFVYGEKISGPTIKQKKGE
jgi:sortase A